MFCLLVWLNMSAAHWLQEFEWKQPLTFFPTDSLVWLSQCATWHRCLTAWYRPFFMLTYKSTIVVSEYWKYATLPLSLPHQFIWKQQVFTELLTNSYDAVTWTQMVYLTTKTVCITLVLLWCYNLQLSSNILIADHIPKAAMTVKSDCTDCPKVYSKSLANTTIKYSGDH